ncbi:cystathionine gamma-synthase [Marinoscillum furvescens]|uniref:Cystathionine gamma-lyase n=1 Tax=Marinoscillum furvescens DSM 4134 TaxID=1122208 RepID=A0A3D9KWG2_MARFU|nr:cystathionine gamma-synthase [Marinoscillum furvescens]RED92476.1 cystathionine gamma-lyase [Marinoscillum furvescens DSM 4134]
MKFGTKAIHAGQEPDPSTGAIMTPIYQTSTFVQASPGDHKGYEYARTQNPTRTALEANIAALEGAKFGRCFSSGMGATDAILKLFEPGDEIVSTNDLYGGTYRMFTKIYAKYGIKFRFVDMKDLDAVKSAVNENTKLVWVETPTNPMMSIVDIEAIVDIAKSVNAKTVVDNTFASPYLQNPIALGADIVMHSVTKYISGHSDVVMGFVGTSDPTIDEQIGFMQNSAGAVPGPQDCFLVLRGIKTLHVRMDRHCDNGEKIAHYLRDHDKVKNVFWPGFSDHPNHDVAKKQMKKFGGMLSFALKDDSQDAAFRLLEKLRVFSLAESLGGVESLAGHPASMTHASIPREQRLEAGLTDSLIRLSVGIEDVDDLLRDLEEAIG